MYKFLLRRKIKKIIKRTEREKAYLNLKEIKTVLVLFDTENYGDAIHFVQQLKKMGKKIKAYAFKNKKDTNNYSKISYTIVTEKDMKNESLIQISNSLNNEKFDLVVDLTLKENLSLLINKLNAKKYQNRCAVVNCLEEISVEGDREINDIIKETLLSHLEVEKNEVVISIIENLLKKL